MCEYSNSPLIPNMCWNSVRGHLDCAEKMLPGAIQIHGHLNDLIRSRWRFLLPWLPLAL